MKLKEISDRNLIEELKLLRGKEREVTLKILLYLIEIDRRGIYRDYGYSSLFAFCTIALGYSEASAGRRVRSCRAMKENSELIHLYRAGKISLSSISAVAGTLKKENKDRIIPEIQGASRRTVEKIVARENPSRIIPKSRISARFVEQAPTPISSDTKPKIEERYEIKLSVSKECFEKFNKVRALSSHATGAKLERVFEHLLDRYLKQREPVRKRSSSTSSRYVSKAAKAEVLKRDNHQCMFVGKDGVRCQETHFLEFDHIQPYALGGTTTPDNLRLLCSAHNRLLSERTFGFTVGSQHVTPLQ